MSGVMTQVDVGPQATWAGDGAALNVRGGKTGEVVVSELSGRFYESAYRGQVFRGGMTLTAINNVTFTSGTLGATCTPIAGIYNPYNSGVNAVVLQCVLGVTVTAATNTGGAPFVWAAQSGQIAITTGAAPYNMQTLQQTGSKVKNMANAALTGLATNLVILGAAGVTGGSLANFSFVGTAVGQVTGASTTIDNVDGSIIVPPGGVLALLATTTPVAHSAASMLVWQELPI